MGDYFIGELRVFAHDRIPTGWVPCDGRILNITGNQALYSLVGTAFGGNGQTTFGVPDLRGRVTMGSNSFATQRGTQSGSETVTLTATQVPSHTHSVGAMAGTSAVPAGPFTSNYISEAKQLPAAGSALPFNVYGPTPTTPPAPTNVWAPLDSSTFSQAGGGQPHENRQPVLPLQICICATGGSYPSRN